MVCGFVVRFVICGFDVSPLLILLLLPILLLLLLLPSPTVAFCIQIRESIEFEPLPRFFALSLAKPPRGVNDDAGEAGWRLKHLSTKNKKHIIFLIFPLSF